MQGLFWELLDQVFQYAPKCYTLDWTTKHKPFLNAINNQINFIFKKAL